MALIGEMDTMSCDLHLQIPVGVLELRPAAWFAKRGLAGPGSRVVPVVCWRGVGKNQSRCLPFEQR